MATPVDNLTILGTRHDLLPVALFDLDGVLIDTEPTYYAFWHKVGQDYFPTNTHFAAEIKVCKSSFSFVIFSMIFINLEI